MLEPQEGMQVQEIVAWAKYAERSGYGCVLRSDHLLPIEGRKDQDSPEAWVTLGILAAETKTIKFGSLVTPIGFRNPVLLARMACNVNDYSHGRLMLGIGAGWYKEEYFRAGYDFPKFQIRYKQFMEALNIITPLIKGIPVDFQGTYFMARTSCYPKRKMHLIIGGRNIGFIRAAEKYADEWNIADIPIQDTRELIAKKKRSKRIEVSRMGPFFLAENRRQLKSKLKHKTIFNKIYGTPLKPENLRKRGVLCGTVDEFNSQINALKEAGIQKFYFQILNPKDKEMVSLLTRTLRTS